MKWNGYSRRASERATRFIGEVFGNKGIYYLLVVLGLGMLLGAGFKWHP